MNKKLKYVLIGVGSLLLIGIATLVFVAMTFDPNAYKPQIISLVKDKKQRILKIDGDIKLSLFPNIGAEVGRIWLSEHASDQQFAKVESARVSLKLFPLLRKQLVIDEIAGKKLDIRIIRYQDGSFNIDDLFQSEQKTEFAFDIANVAIEDANLAYVDEANHKQYELTKLNIKTGRIAKGVSSSVEAQGHLASKQENIALDFQIKSKFMFDPEKGHYVLNGTDANVKGTAFKGKYSTLNIRGDMDVLLPTQEFNLSGMVVKADGVYGQDKFTIDLNAPKLYAKQSSISSKPMELNAKIFPAQGEATLKLAVPALEGAGHSFKTAPLVADIDWKQDKDSVKAKLSMPLQVTRDQKTFAFSEISSPQVLIDTSGKLNDMGFSGKANSNFDYRFVTKELNLANLNLDLSLANADWQVKNIAARLYGALTTNFAKQRSRIQLAGKFDQSQLKSNFGVSGYTNPEIDFDIDIDVLDMDRYLASKSQNSKQVEEPIDLSKLQKLNAHGVINIGTLKVSNIKSSQVKLEIRADKNTLALNSMQANLYQGSTRGSLLIQNASPPKITLKQNLSNISVGPFLRDAVNKDILEGVGSVNLDVQSRGATFSNVKKSLSGHASVNIANGALKGVNLPAVIRDAQARLGSLRGKQTQASNKAEKTEFSELKASFNIKGGVAHNEDLILKSSLIHLTGRGDIDVGNDRINYLSKVQVVGNIAGNAIKELAALRGVSIPVQVYGPINSPQYNLDFNSLVAETAKQKIENKTQQITNRAEEKLKDKIKNLFGR